MMNEAEQRVVAQAITDAHAHKPGLDSDGRMEDARTFIAAFDAIEKFRAMKPAKASATRETSTPATTVAEPTPPPATPTPQAESTPPPPPSQDVPPPEKAKAKGRKAA